MEIEADPAVNHTGDPAVSVPTFALKALDDILETATPAD